MKCSSMKYIGNNLKVSNIDQYAGEVMGIVENSDGIPWAFEKDRRLVTGISNQI